MRFDVKSFMHNLKHFLEISVQVRGEITFLGGSSIRMFYKCQECGKTLSMKDFGSLKEWREHEEKNKVKKS